MFSGLKVSYYVLTGAAIVITLLVILGLTVLIRRWTNISKEISRPPASGTLTRSSILAMDARRQLRLRDALEQVKDERGSLQKPDKP